MAKSGVKVLIVGGSVAGLTLANALSQSNIPYLLLERWHDIAPDVGASISIFPNGFRILDQLGCYAAIRALRPAGDELDNIYLRNERGEPIYEAHGTKERYTRASGYEPNFVDRKDLVRMLYENLKDPSRILLSKSVKTVSQSASGVEVTCEDGSIFTSDILVGADGVHSIVRREMWRTAESKSPGYFPTSQGLDVLTNYQCLFGISRCSPKFHAQSVQYTFGNGHSHLNVSATDDRMYWFIFKKLDKPVHGLYERLPRYTAADADALAKQHYDDPLGDGLTFREVYERKMVATLQATPETVFETWHYGRMISIGDAAHKLLPIFGQGGNSALEDAATLANHLFALLRDSEKGKDVTTEAIQQLFTNVQSQRHARMASFLRLAARQQSIHAMQGVIPTLVARYVMPRASQAMALGSILNPSRGASRLEMLPILAQRQVGFFDDERKENRSERGWLRAKYIVCSLAGVMVAYVTVQTLITTPDLGWVRYAMLSDRSGSA